MSVNLTGMENAGLNWDSILNAVNSQESTTRIDAVNVSTDAQNVGLTFTVNDGGTVRTVALSMPMLDSPSEIDESLLAGFCAKIGDQSMLNLSDAQIKAFCDELTAQLGVLEGALSASGASTIADSKASQSVMFDIYALMALLVECGQRMRDAARDVRQAENVQVQKSIQNQADMQRSAAITGLICSVVVCAVQVGVQAANLTYQGRGFGKQMGSHKMSGLEKAKAELKMAELQCKPQDAQANLDRISQRVDPATKAKVEGTFNDSQATRTEINEIKVKIDADERELAELQALKEKNTSLTEGQQATFDRLNAEIPQEKAALADKQMLFRTQVKSELADIRSNPASTPEEIAYAEAYAANEIAQNSTPQQLTDDLLLAQSNYNQASAVMQHDAGYMKGQHIENRARMFGDLITAIGNVAQGCVSSMSQMISAEATEEGAQQQRAQEMLDQAKDLFSQCQSLIDSVIQLMRAVLQAEVQSMRDAIHA